MTWDPESYVMQQSFAAQQQRSELRRFDHIPSAAPAVDPDIPEGGADCGGTPEQPCATCSCQPGVPSVPGEVGEDQTDECVPAESICADCEHVISEQERQRSVQAYSESLCAGCLEDRDVQAQLVRDSDARSWGEAKGLQS